MYIYTRQNISVQKYSECEEVAIFLFGVVNGLLVLFL